MSNRLQNKAQKSKLQTNSLNEKDLGKTPEFFLNKKNTSAIRSFRLDNQTWQDLQNILIELNNHSKRKKVSASSLIKALIYLGKKTKSEKILDILKEVSY